MATSTVNGQPVKSGVGLGYVDAVYEAPMGGFVQGVQLAPAPVASVYMAAPQSMPIASDFPILGATVTQAPVQWGPPGGVVYSAAPPQAATVMAGVTPREGVVFDGSHPRNTFAKRPSVGAVTVASAGPIIDWSSNGTPLGLQQNIIRGGGGAAHVSPIVAAQPVQQVPLNVLRSQMGATQSFVQQPPPPQNNNRQMRAAGMIQQPRGR